MSAPDAVETAPNPSGEILRLLLYGVALTLCFHALPILLFSYVAPTALTLFPRVVVRFSILSFALVILLLLIFLAPRPEKTPGPTFWGGTWPAAVPFFSLVASFFVLKGIIFWSFGGRPIAEPGLFSQGWETGLLILWKGVVLAPLWEELLFLGYLFGGLLSFWRPGPVVITTSLLWTLAHVLQADGVTALYLLLFGLFLGFSRQLTGSILYPLVIHFLNNLLALLAPDIMNGWENRP